MPYYLVKIDVLVEVDEQIEACDAIAETMRPNLREFAPHSSIIDWRYSEECSVPVEHDGSGFEYAEAADDSP